MSGSKVQSPPAPPKSRSTLVSRFPKGTRWPNMHEWAFAVFAFITWYILDMIKNNPALLGVPSFMQFAQAIVGGGLLACAAWLWSSNRGKDKVDEEAHNVKPPKEDIV